MLASQNSYRDVVELLYKSGADINCINNEGHTSLKLAIDKGQRNMIEYLCKIESEAKLAAALMVNQSCNLY